MSFTESANSSAMYILGIFIALFITIISIVFMIRSYKQAIKIGIEKKVISKVIRSSCIFTIIPSTAILLGLITMSGGLGVPLSWIRLSVIGAVQYELIAANAAATSAGLKSLLLEYMTPQVFVSIATVMTICILSGPIFNLFFLKKYNNGLKNIQAKDNRWGKLIVDSMFMGMICTFLGNPIINIRADKQRGWISLSVMGFSALIMFLCTRLIKKFNWKSIEGFSLPLSMISGMAFAIFIEKLFF